MSERVGDDLVRALVADDSAVPGFVGRGDFCRIYPQIRVQEQGNKGIGDDLPAIIYDMEGQSEPITTDGNCSLRRQGWRVVCFAQKYTELDDLSGAVIRALSGYVSDIILEILVGAATDDYEDETNTHERQIDLTVTAWS